MCGCGRTSMPRPAGSRAGPNSSTKMNGPTIVRCRPGNVRLTLKSPRSCVTGVMTCSNAASTVAIVFLLHLSDCVEPLRRQKCLAVRRGSIECCHEIAGMKLEFAVLLCLDRILQDDVDIRSDVLRGDHRPSVGTLIQQPDAKLFHAIL